MSQSSSLKQRKSTVTQTQTEQSPQTPQTHTTNGNGASHQSELLAPAAAMQSYSAAKEAALIAAGLPLGATLTIDHIPPYLGFNKHIRVGYRRPMTRWECVRSLFVWHNECTFRSPTFYFFIFLLFYFIYLCVAPTQTTNASSVLIHLVLVGRVRCS